MTRLEASRIELEKHDAFGGDLNKTAQDIIKVLGKEVPFDMALAIANFTMASYVGHFHIKMKIKEDNIPPINMIAFVLAKSGAGKTSSVDKAEKCLKRGYDMINARRQAKLDIENQKRVEEDLPTMTLAPLSNAIATEAGMIQRLNDFKKEGLGLPALFVDEIATALKINPDIKDNMTLIAELFDNGHKKSKPLKDREAQSEEVHGMGMNALFIGSEHGILEDPLVLKDMEDEFMSKFARRCYFYYPDVTYKVSDVEDFDDIMKEIESEEKIENDYIKDLNKIAVKIANKYLTSDINIVNVPDSIKRISNAYEVYCKEMAKSISNEQLQLEQHHRHWKVLKLAGVYAIFNGHEEIMKSDYKEAIACAERTKGDMEKFMLKAKREKYEVLAEYFINGGEPIGIHDMVKRGWIKKKINLKDMIINANSMLGNKGLLEEIEDTVRYTEFETRELFGASYKVLEKDMPKEKRKFNIDYGYKYKEVEFEELQKLLTKDCAYTPFKFKTKEEGAIYNKEKHPNAIKGIKGRENIISGASFVVLDIDDTDMPWHECSDMLADYRHIIAMTSDGMNIYKYRVIMPTDIIVKLDSQRWMAFIKKVGKHLNMNIDILAQSQVLYGYSNRNVLINIEGEDLEASELIKNLGEKREPIKRLQNDKLINQAWIDRREVFDFAYNVKSGNGLHTCLFTAMKKAWELGMNYDMNCLLLDDIIEHKEEKPRASFIPSLESQRKALYNKDKEQEEWKYEPE